jgi:ribonuclease HI
MICKLYIETSIKWSHPGDGIVGIALAVDDHDAKTIYGFVKNCSESKAVIIAFTKALEYCSRYKDIELNISCNQVGHALINGWLDKWEANYYLGADKKVIKHAKEWHELYQKLRGKSLKIHLNEFNGYRNYLNCECLRRMAKHERILQSVEDGKK